MHKNIAATAFYSIFLFILIIFMLGCGSNQTVIVDPVECYAVEIIDKAGVHHIIPISDIETMQYTLDGWFIWKKDNTGWFGVEVIGYGEDPNCTSN